MEYNKFAYLFPPRPENPVMPSMISFYENRKWVAQFKMNGTCNIIAVAPDKSLICKSRHGDDHKAWTLTDITRECFSQLPGNSWYVFVAELLHSKGPSIKDTNFVHDVLVDNGEYLVGERYQDRYERLLKIFNVADCKVEDERSYRVHSNLMISKIFTSDFKGLYERIAKRQSPLEEGIVLKDPNARLKMCSRISSNTEQVKVRIGTKNYTY